MDRILPLFLYDRKQGRVCFGLPLTGRNHVQEGPGLKPLRVKQN